MFKIEDNFFRVFNEISKKMFDYVDKQFNYFGITRVQWAALINIYNFDNLTQTELADMMNIKASTAVRLLDRMETNGLINRVEQSKDRRKVTLLITPKGEDYINRLSLEVGNINKSIIKNITKEELEVLNNIMNKMIKNVS
jgi:DNA-binding MarR family transcriptional regulator